MSFDTRETSAFDGEPQELYWFMRDSDEWFYTSGAYPIDFNLETFEPLAGLVRESVVVGPDQGRTQLSVTMPRTAAVAQEFITIPRQTAMWLYIYRIHEGESDYRIFYQGRVSSVDFKGEKATLQLDNIMASTKKQSFRAFFQNQCNNFMFDANCTLNEIDFSHAGITVSTVDGDTITFDSSVADGGFISGQIKLANGDRRMVVNDVKSGSTHTVTLLQAFETLQVGDTITAIEGVCRHTFDTCHAGNEANYGGYPLVPRKDPFKSFI